jgi:hypothetical protein
LILRYSLTFYTKITKDIKRNLKCPDLDSSARIVVRYQRGNQNPYIEVEQKGQKKKYKRTNNDLQNIHIKKIEKHEPPLKSGGEPGAPEG